MRLDIEWGLLGFAGSFAVRPLQEAVSEASDGMSLGRQPNAADRRKRSGGTCNRSCHMHMFFENYYLQTANWETHKQGTFMGRIARFPAPELVESLVSLLAR